MTLVWISFVFIVAWSLGRAQLRAEISDRELNRHPTDTNEYLNRRRGY